MHVMTNGQVVHTGPSVSTHNPPKMQTIEAKSGEAWQDFGTSVSGGAASTMYVAGNSATGAKAKILKTGAGAAISAQAEIIDEDGNSTVTSSMTYARKFHDSVVLPDGTVLVAGGGNQFGPTLADAVKQTELWDPDTEDWTELAPSPTDRMYHSTLVLLPDARLLSAGGETFDFPQIHNRDADFFAPPYLYKNNNLIADSERPQVVGQPPTLVGTGATFSVTVTPPTGTSIHSTRGAVFLRPGAVTHSNNMEQRYVPLSFTSVVSGANEVLTLTAPTSIEECPPGYYMLFFLNDDSGVLRPSKADFVRVWGIPQASVSDNNFANGVGGFEVDIDWSTTLAASGADQVLFYRQTTPTSSFDPPVSATCVSGCSNTGLEHSGRWQVSPCESGYWYYEVRSSTTGAVTTSVGKKLFLKKIKNCLI